MQLHTRQTAQKELSRKSKTSLSIRPLEETGGSTHASISEACSSPGRNNSAEQGCRVTHQSPEVITTHPPENVGGLFGVLLLIRCQHVHNLLCVHAVVVRQVLHQLPRRFLPFLCVHIIGQEAVALAAV